MSKITNLKDFIVVTGGHVLNLRPDHGDQACWKCGCILTALDDYECFSQQCEEVRMPADEHYELYPKPQPAAIIQLRPRKLTT